MTPEPLMKMLTTLRNALVVALGLIVVIFTISASLPPLAWLFKLWVGYWLP